MRNPVWVLKSIEENACNKDYKYERLYRNLYNPEFYLLAYQNIAKSQGSMTAGADGMTLDRMSEVRINQIIASLKDHSYQPTPARREYIAKKNSTKKRPLGLCKSSLRQRRVIMKRAWLYCRIDAPEDQNGVLKKQEKQLFEFSEQLGYQPAGTSSDLDDNCNLENLIRAASVKHFDVLLVGSLFHIHHDRSRAIQYVGQLQSLGVEVISPLEGHISAEEVSL